MQMCLLCPEVALDGFRHEQLEETAEIKRLERARRVAISHAYTHALTTFQVLSPPSMRLLCSSDYLCIARTAVTRCARTHHLKRARRIVHTRNPARPFRSLALPSGLQTNLAYSYAELGGLSRFVQSPTASQEQGGSPFPPPTRKPARPFRSLALHLCFQMNLTNSLQSTEGCHALCKDPFPKNEQGGSPTRTPTLKPARPFGSTALPSCLHRDRLNSFAERGGLSRFVQGPTASQEQGGSPSSTPTRKP